MRVLRGSLIVLLLVGCASPHHVNDSPSKTERQSSYHQAALLQVELGLAYLQQGDIERAKEKLLHALELAPKISETHIGMAYLFEKVGDNSASEKEYLKALRFKTEKRAAPIYNNYGAFLCRQNRFSEADQYFQKAITNPYYSKTAKVYDNAGMCAMQGKDYSKAAYYLRLAISHNPKEESSYLTLMRVLLLQKQVAEAEILLTDYHRRFGINEESQKLQVLINTAQQQENENSTDSKKHADSSTEKPESTLIQQHE